MILNFTVLLNVQQSTADQIWVRTVWVWLKSSLIDSSLSSTVSLLHPSYRTNINARMKERTDEQTDGRSNARMKERMNRDADGRTDKQMDEAESFAPEQKHWTAVHLGKVTVV